jgi:hypothetical protein
MMSSASRIPNVILSTGAILSVCNSFCQWIWGGPCDTREELGSKFGGVVSETLIEEVATQIEKHGPSEWVPVQKVEDWEDIDWSDKFDEPAPLDIYLDEPSPRYGTQEEREARAKARTALAHLERALERRRPIGIGHNQPPEEPKIELQQVREAVKELKLEFGKPNPKISIIKRWAAPLRNALILCGKWTGKKLDKGADATIKVVGAGIGTFILGQCFPSLHNVFSAIIDWLEIAAKSVF